MAVDPAPVLILSGAARLQPPGGAPVRLERKQAALLAWLAIEGPAPRARLAGLLWPEVPEARSRANLRQCLMRLRQLGGPLVDDAGGQLRLAAAAVLAPLQPHDPPLLDADRYDDLPDFGFWLEARREARRAGHRRDLMARVQAALAAGELDRALADADALLAADRESEEAYRTVMEVLYLRADHAAAIAVWDRCREMLRSLYGIGPSAATQRLGELLLQASAAPPPRPLRAEALPASVQRPPRLVGRARELQALQAAWADGAVPCVGGDAGLGKSRLLADFAAGLGPHAMAGARPGDAVLPYASLSRLLLAALDRFQPPLDGADDALAAARLLPRLAAQLARSARSAAGTAPAPDATLPALQPVQTAYERTQALLGVALLLGRCVAAGCRLFVFDDLQFIDPQSAEALTMLAEPALPTQRTPLRFAFGLRAGEAPPSATALLDALAATRHFVRIDLPPLEAPAIEQLLASLAIDGLDAAQLAPRLSRQVGGNPAYVLESVKLLLSQGVEGALAGGGALPLPPGVRQMVERQVSALSEPARHLAQLAALAGSEYSLALATGVLACNPLQLAAPLRELAARQLFDGQAFCHDVVAEAVRSGLPTEVAALMHRLIATQLEAQAAEPAAVAGHWRAAGDFARAGQAYCRAAAAAGAASLPVAQAGLLDLAVACLETVAGHDGDAQAALFDALAQRLVISAAPDYVQRRLPLLEQLERLARTDAQRLRALQLRLGWRASQGMGDRVAENRAAMEQARALDLPALAWGFVAPLSWQLAQRGDIDEALALLAQQGEWMASQGDALERAEYHNTLAGVLAWGDRLGAAIGHQRAAVSGFRAAGQPVRCLPVLSNQGLIHHWRGELAEARAVLAQAATLRDRVEGRGSALLIDVNLAAVLRDLAHYPEAVSLLEGVLGDLRTAGAGDHLAMTDCVMAENQLAQTWLALGQQDRATTCLATADLDAALHLRARRLVLQLRAARRKGGDRALWLAQLRQIGPLQTPFQQRLQALELAREQTPAEAMAALDEALRDPVLEQRPGLAWHVALRRAERLLQLGRPALALGALQAWLHSPTDLQPYDIEPGEAAAIGVQVLVASGQEQAAAQRRATACEALRAVSDGLPPAWRVAFEKGVPSHRQLLHPVAASSA